MTEENQKKKDGIRRAVALQYKPEKHQAPIISASGRGWLAERIVKLAREHRIPIVEDTSLVKVLGSLSLGEEVPRELYEAVAAVYAFVMEADRRRGTKHT